MRKALEGHSGDLGSAGKPSTISGMPTIVLLALSTPGKLQELLNRVESAARGYNMTMNAATTKSMTNTEAASDLSQKGGRVEYVITRMKKLFIML